MLRAFQLGAIKRLLLAFNFAEQIFLHAVRQIAGDLGLRAAEQERADARGEAAACVWVFLRIVKLAELRTAAEHAGHGKGHQAPQIQQAILDGRAAEDEAVFGAQGAGDLRGLRGWVLDVLAFVEDDGLEVRAGQRFANEAELGVVEDVQVGGVGERRQVLRVGAVPDLHAEAGGEAVHFRAPVVSHALRTHDE